MCFYLARLRQKENPASWLETGQLPPADGGGPPSPVGVDGGDGHGAGLRELLFVEAMAPTKPEGGRKPEPAPEAGLAMRS